ncbi:DUF6502 family protein [Bauldia sp.]|uniref:DUF6502 family protein n=1 Tax=Bauldia sp. TaxID=2575872 RepID=UPI003BAC676D
MSEPISDARAEAFSKVIQWLLRPLVRALIAQGVTALALYRMIKRIYVDVAEEELAKAGQRPTDSRISVLTGVHRRDIRAFRDESSEDAAATRQKVTMIASVLGRWLADPKMVDTDGQPRPLPRTSDDGVDFDSLVRSVSRDIRPRTVLDELDRQGLVSTDPETGLIRLQADAFLGPADLDQRIHFFAENVGDHIAAAVENLLADEPPFMERAVFYNRLTPDSVDEIESTARSRATDLLVSLNRLAHSRQAADLDAPDGTERFRFGVFFYREDEATRPSARTTAEKDDADGRA